MQIKRLFSYSRSVRRNWNESDTLVDKKSKFQGRCLRITSPQEVPELIDELMASERSLSKASHPTMYAWRVGKMTSNKKEPKYEFINQSSHDNGEGGSGARLLGFLERLKLVNVLVVVSRWYGGVPLGPQRFRDITQVAIDSLQKGGFLNKGKKG